MNWYMVHSVYETDNCERSLKTNGNCTESQSYGGYYEKGGYLRIPLKDQVNKYLDISTFVASLLCGLFE